MNLQLEYNISTMIGDILSKDGNYVELLSCNEYSVWYLIRQTGIFSSLAALHTKAFIVSNALEEETYFGYHEDINIRRLLYNLDKYFGIKTIAYEEKNESIETFIKTAIRKGRFVYTLYDHYYDTLLEPNKFHEYHGHPITGFQDSGGIYYSLFKEEHLVKYSDMEKMCSHCKEVKETYFNRFFYFDIETASLKKLLLSGTEIREELYLDCLNTVNDWRQEINGFEKYIASVKRKYSLNRKNISEFALKQRLVFNSIMEGLHYNFVFKLKTINELLDINTKNLELKFIDNRKRCILIANMYRKLFVISEEICDLNPYINKILDKIQLYFVEESQSLCNQFELLTKEEVGKFHGN